MEGIPLQVCVEVARRDLRSCVKRIQRKTGLPSYLIALVIADVKADVANAELTSLMSQFTTEKTETPAEETQTETEEEEASDNTDE